MFTKIALAAVAAGCVMACSAPASAPDALKTKSEVNQQAWGTEFRRAYPNGNFRFDALYDQAVEHCNYSAEEMAKWVALNHDKGSNGVIDATRMGMSYVCPARVSHIDQAITKVDDGN
ncbi:hypothetical protein AOT83_04845 [Mycobacteroides sp. H001]|uniref:hypothetical protein n=1 Tax=unclassified Mycobacteroides TaxID=2618759 RepID=UPI0007129771|nr:MULTISPECIES: hypothetical protein [unclassified Mycobacteroides]KRQ31324.1 hypothetical protein AOT86_01560 [Mycobacteroides sp. H072]KRQ35918.1 hypothetical protein AOT84_15550 [Mycobacteroides sp. H002]KRQ50543.1 hypothetical protein AOT85_13680 [Mycobacteroides sp. H054]KRQ72695.1 hypothetical protein AOT83_04845 [Mycobacteroides sp. H001]